MSLELQKCYQEQLLDKGIAKSRPACLVIGIDENGKLNFFDIDDHSKNISTEFHQCLSSLVKF
jgi:hypothetical protein